MSTQPTPVEVFCSYAHEDEVLFRKLEAHLSLLKWQGLISVWRDRLIAPGIDWKQAIDAHLETASVILLLVSADFFASDYCYGIEMKRAMERHTAGEARVIPIILRSVHWQDSPFKKLQVLPIEGKPIASRHWRNQNEAFDNVVKGIRRVIEEINTVQTGVRKTIKAPTPSPTSSSRISNLPFPRNPLFTGRQDILTHLHDTLSKDKAAALMQATQNQQLAPQAISGLGGIGKTQTALEYAYRHANDYSYIFWVKSETREELISDFIAIASLLNLPEKNAQDQSQIVAAVKHWLQEHTGWLLIFDNADDLSMVRDYLPSGNKGHILLTTRAQAMGRIAQRIEIEKMGLDEGALFLLRRANIIGQDASLDTAQPADLAKAIVQALDGLPLALDQAGAYIEETSCGLARYLDLYQKQHAKLLKRRGGLVSDHPKPVATTWQLSFQKVEQANPAAADLLRLCAFLSPDAIPEEIITKGASELGPILQPVAEDQFELDAAIKELRKYSLVRRDADAQTITVHRLVQEVLRDEMDKETQRQWAERAVRALDNAFPNVDYETWPECERLLPHAQVCAIWIGQWEMAFLEAARLLNQVGYYLWRRAQYTEAEPFYQKALALREQVVGAEHPDVAASLNNLALLYHAQGKYAEAEPLYLRALRIREQQLGPDHPQVASPLNNLANNYREQGKYAEAEPLYLRALRIREQQLGPDHPETVDVLHDFASFQVAQGNAPDALSLYQRALEIRKRLFGTHHPKTEETRQCVLLVLQKLGRHEEAASLQTILSEPTRTEKEQEQHSEQ